MMKASVKEICKKTIDMTSLMARKTCSKIVDLATPKRDYSYLTPEEADAERHLDREIAKIDVAYAIAMTFIMAIAIKNGIEAAKENQQ